MNYQTVSSSNEGRDGLIGNLGMASLMLFGLQLILWIGNYESAFELNSWQVVGLAVLASMWLTITFLYLGFKKGQGTQTTADFGHGIVAVKHGDLWGVFAAERRELFLPFEFTSIRVVSQDRYGKPTHLELEQAGLVGLYSLLEWRHVIPVQYKLITKLNDNLCAVQGPDDKWGIWSLKRDRLVMPVEYPGYKVWYRCHDFVGVPDGKSERRKWAIFSVDDERLVTPYIYDDIDYLGDGVFKLQVGQRKLRSGNSHLRFGLYLHLPRVTIKPIYPLIKEFEPDLLELQEGGLRGLISTKTGRIVVPVEYWSMRRVSERELELQSKNKRRTVDLTNLRVA